VRTFCATHAGNYTRWELLQLFVANWDKIEEVATHVAGTVHLLSDEEGLSVSGSVSRRGAPAPAPSHATPRGPEPAVFPGGRKANPSWVRIRPGVQDCGEAMNRRTRRPTERQFSRARTVQETGMDDSGRRRTSHYVEWTFVHVDA
jgi:hypothetical protein